MMAMSLQNGLEQISRAPSESDDLDDDLEYGAIPG